MSENAYRDNLISVPLKDVILGGETELSIDVVANSTMTITFFFGAVISQSSALKRKVNRAIRHISKVGLENARNYPGKFYPMRLGDNHTKNYR